MKRQEFVDKMLTERERQFNLPGTEGDILKSPNDWVATIGSLLGEAVNRAGSPSSEEFERSLVKVMAVSLAALEHITVMEQNRKLGRD